MLDVIPYKNKEKWNKLVKSFSNWDVYYLWEYSYPLINHGDGTPLLIYFEDAECRLCYVVMLNDIAQIKAYKGYLNYGEYFDIATPYGYGGPLVNGKFNLESKNRFITELNKYCNDKRIITQFIRFHPLYQNQTQMESICEMTSLKDTIVIDTSTPEVIFENLDSKNRNMIRKAEKCGVTVNWDNGDRLDDFIRIYEHTMKERQADDYFYFSSLYYEFLKNEMNNNAVFFYSYFGSQIVGSAIFLYNNYYMHYHLSGVLSEYRKMASTNLLLYQAALWASQQGIDWLHLGGGIGAHDSLFEFKRKFNKNGRLPFYIGRNIFNREAYLQLLQTRGEIDPNFNKANSYLIQYRQE